MIAPQTGSFLPAARRCAWALLFLSPLMPPATAQAQMLRGSLEALPGQDADFSPYALDTAPDTAFEPPPFARAEPTATAAPAAAATRRSIVPENDPYAQLGIRAGAFLIKPSVELYGGHDSNPLSIDPAEGSARGHTRARIDVESDWARHAFRGRVQHDYRFYDEFPELDAPTWSADAALRLDARHDLRFDFGLRGVRDSTTRGDPELVGVSGLVENTRIGASAAMTYKPNRLSFTPRVVAERRTFEDAGFDNRNYSSYEAALRTGYELSPALEPFAEIVSNERKYDERVGAGGLLHDSWGWRGFVGARFEPDPIWALEAKIGYGTQDAEDAAIPEIEGFAARGTLIWRPSALTTVRLNAERDFSAATLGCCAVTEYWRVGAQFTHEFRRWLILTGEAAWSENSYPGSDYKLKDLNAELALEYKFNRYASAIGRIAYDRLDSSFDPEDYEATVFEVGLRVQR